MVYPLSAKNSPSTMLAIIQLSWKAVYFCYFLRQVQTFEVQTKSAKLLKSSAVYCVSLQKYSVFSTMQGCIVPPKSNKLIACVWNVAKTCVLDSFKTVILFLSFQRILSIWNRFRPVLQGKPLEQIRNPTALPAVSFAQPFDWLKGCFVYTSKTVLSSLPPVKRGVMR